MCTLETRGRVFLLTLNGADEHLLSPTLLNSIRSALAQIRSDSAASGGRAALVTAAEGKFFSNGLDLAFARSSPSDQLTAMGAALKDTIADILALPMPTVAAVTGHAAAGACGVVLAHDYVVMRRDRGFFYLSELDVGLPIGKYFMQLVRNKIRDPRSLRRVLLQAERVAAAEGVEMGIVDRAVTGAAEAVAAAVEMAEKLAGKGWDGGVYASLRRAALPEVFDALAPAVGSDAAEETTPTLANEKPLKSRL